MKIYGIASVLFVLLNVMTRSAGKTLSFEVLSVLPSSTVGGREELRNSNTPLTVVFSLPVIRLGTL